MAKDLTHWATHANGDIIVKPLVAVETAPVAGMFGLLRIQYLTGEPHRPEGSLQLGMSIAQIRQVAEMLTRLADRLEQASTDGPRN